MNLSAEFQKKNESERQKESQVKIQRLEFTM